VKIGRTAELEGFYLDGVIALQDLFRLVGQHPGGGLDLLKRRFRQAIVQARHPALADRETPGGCQERQPSLPSHAAVRSVVFASKESRRLPKQDASNPAGPRNRGRIRGHLGIEAIHHDLQEFDEAASFDVFEASLAAEVRQSEALA
jgi:hypothetical protein